jgi:hypothetical protein
VRYKLANTSRAKKWIPAPFKSWLKAFANRESCNLSWCAQFPQANSKLLQASAALGLPL